jgi:hypothetical protein
MLNPFLAGAATDPFFSSVVQLAHFDGSNGSTTFTNSCPRGDTLGATGTAALSTNQSKWGAASLRINSSGSARSTGHTDYLFTTGAFTIEFWIRLTSIANDQVLYSWNLPSAFHFRRIGTNGVFRINEDSTTRITSGVVLVANTWHFISYSKEGVNGNGNLHCDGSLQGTWTDTLNHSSSAMYVGNYDGGDLPLTDGYISDLRVTKGVGRYTNTGYSVPTAAFPNS